MDVLFVSMPFGPVLTPSLGISLLQSHLLKSGINSKILYASLDFAELLGTERYVRLQESGPGLLLGEYCFANYAFPDSFEESFEAASITYGNFFRYVSNQLKEDVSAAKAKSGLLLELIIGKIDRLEPKIVVCSSMFQQNLASLALFNLLKNRCFNKHIVTIMGGCNTEYSLGLGLLRRCKNLDYVCSGSGEETLPLLCKNLIAIGAMQILPELNIDGVYSQSSLQNYTEVEPSLASMTRGRMSNLNNSLPPDFNDYFDQLNYSCLDISPAIPIESSRGCWWGEKSHCTFCGLNGDDLSFKYKDYSGVGALVLDLSSRYEIRDFTFVDNIIPREYFDTLLPLLEGCDFNFFYETKANLSKDHVAQFKRSGVNHIQPGIESLLDDVLQLMRKGTTQLINIECLKFCAEYAIIPHWSVLWNFPGEDPNSYKRYLELIPKITHLHPPGAMVAIRFDKFSPYQLNPSDWGLKLSPLDAYHFLYPGYLRSLDDIAYFFRRSDQPYHPVPFSHPEFVTLYNPIYEEVYKHVLLWKALWHDYSCPPKLQFCKSGSSVLVYDSRNGDPVSTGISETEYLILNLLETKRPLSFVLKECMVFDPDIDENVLLDILDILICQNWVIRSKKQYLALITNPEKNQYCLRSPSGRYHQRNLPANKSQSNSLVVA
jgi:magnesium-protoporphyrin IX monomethyl ester (oxidative) cyclase